MGVFHWKFVRADIRSRHFFVRRYRPFHLFEQFGVGRRVVGPLRRRGRRERRPLRVRGGRCGRRFGLAVGRGLQQTHRAQGRHDRRVAFTAPAHGVVGVLRTRRKSNVCAYALRKIVL